MIQKLLPPDRAAHMRIQGIVFDSARERLSMPSFQTVVERDEIGLIHAYVVQQARRATGGG